MDDWLTTSLATLTRQPVCGYARGGPDSTEPTAIAALALLAHGREEPALAAGRWLASLQAAEGSLGVRADHARPRWPTSLAILVWSELAARGHHEFTDPIEKAIAWTLSAQGKPLPRHRHYGHDTTLVAWPWVEGTHSWLEPTSLFVLALRRRGLGEHQRTREALRLVHDRILPAGGCNYGNTVIMGNMLRPHVQPSGIVLLALAGKTDPGGRVGRTVAYLRRTIDAQTTSSSLAWAVLGLRSHDTAPRETAARLAAAADRTIARDGSPYKLALLSLAAASGPTGFSVGHSQAAEATS